MDQTSPVTQTEIFSAKKLSGTQLPPKDDLDARQKELWRLAAKHVVPWDKLQRNDYDFQSWTKNASDDLLNAGCCYEYARESHKLRCLLVICALKRKRKLTGPLVLKISEYPTRWGTYLIESGWERWLSTFTDELASNKSFADLHRTDRTKVKESLKALPSYSVLPKAVESPGRYVDYPGSAILPIQFFWRDYTNKEIGKELAILTGKLRPIEEPEPQRKGKGKPSSIKSALNALSVMRIWERFPKAKHLRQRIRGSWHTTVDRRFVGLGSRSRFKGEMLTDSG
jgi:hypothetical protein